MKILGVFAILILKFVKAFSIGRDEVIEVSAGEIIPYDGEIIEGVATIDESVFTGESAPVLKEAGGNQSKVYRGSKVLSNSIKIKILSTARHKFLKEIAKKNKVKSKVNHINFGI